MIAAAVTATAIIDPGRGDPAAADAPAAEETPAADDTGADDDPGIDDTSTEDTDDGSNTDDDGADQSPSTRTTDTRAAEIRDLVETARLSGSLGYDDPIVLVNRAAGTVTSVIRAGENVARGDELYRIDEKPVIALYGESGAWRDLGAGIDPGSDVRQLEENLAALGHDPKWALTIDDKWDAATTAAVKRWEAELGIAENGAIALGEIVFVPGPGLVSRVDAGRGMGVGEGTQMLAYQTHVDTDTISGTRKGNITDLAPVGTAVAAGTELFAVNTNKTYALLGDHVRNDRTLKSGVADGIDIEALEENLTALGHDPDETLTVDRRWDDATTDAVNRWLASLDLDQTGTTTPELFEFVEPDSIVTVHLRAVGDEVDEPFVALEVGRSLRKVVTSISPTDQELVAVGDIVTIILPDGAETDGAIAEIATSASTGEDGSTSIAVEIDPVDPSAIGELVEAPVRVQVERKRTEGVLAVPTASLVGLVQGGHAVEIVQADGTRQLVAVELGEAADGWIALTAGAVSEGDLVVVPR